MSGDNSNGMLPIAVIDALLACAAAGAAPIDLRVIGNRLTGGTAQVAVANWVEANLHMLALRQRAYLGFTAPPAAIPAFAVDGMVAEALAARAAHVEVNARAAERHAAAGGRVPPGLALRNARRVAAARKAAAAAKRRRAAQAEAARKKGKVKSKAAVSRATKGGRR